MKVDVITPPYQRFFESNTEQWNLSIQLTVIRYSETAKKLRVKIGNHSVEIDISDCPLNQECQRQATLTIPAPNTTQFTAYYTNKTTCSGKVNKPIVFVTDGTVVVRDYYYPDREFKPEAGKYYAVAIDFGSNQVECYELEGQLYNREQYRPTFEALDASGNVLDSGQAGGVVGWTKVLYKLVAKTVDVTGKLE